MNFIQRKRTFQMSTVNLLVAILMPYSVRLFYFNFFPISQSFPFQIYFIFYFFVIFGHYSSDNTKYRQYRYYFAPLVSRALFDQVCFVSVVVDYFIDSHLVWLTNDRISPVYIHEAFLSPILSQSLSYHQSYPNLHFSFNSFGYLMVSGSKQVCLPSQSANIVISVDLWGFISSILFLFQLGSQGQKAGSGFSFEYQGTLATFLFQIGEAICSHVASCLDLFCSVDLNRGPLLDTQASQFRIPHHR